MLAYSRIIGSNSLAGEQMNIALGFKIIAVLALVAASTTVIVQMEQAAAAQNSQQLHNR